MKLKINIDGKNYLVEVEPVEEESSSPNFAPAQPLSFAPVAMPPAAPPVAPAAGEEAVDENKVCRSPIAGVVVRLNAQEGQQVQVGDQLIVLEAMKMETAITSPVQAKLKKYRVAQGESVQGGQILVDFE
ncbi:MAG: acetyl-CoA carboxylase biotin carboxyl carrier protein subunit [Bryobacteraceae bacterium]